LVKQKVKGRTIDRQDVIAALRSKCKARFNKDCKEMGFYLVKFNGKTGILRCKHVEKDDAIKLLRSLKQISSQNIQIETIGTSGTIKALEKKQLSKLL